MKLSIKRDSKLEQLIINGYYYEAKEYIADFSEDDYFSYLSCFAHDENNLAAYSFACFMYEQTLKEEWCEFIVFLASIDLVYIEGMNYILIYYVRELVRKNRTVENLSVLLELNFYPDTCNLIDESESRLIAKEILESDKSEKVANKYMQELFDKNYENKESEQEDFVTYLEKGFYEEALDFLENKDSNSNRDFCVEYAKREQSIEIYNFVRYMINKTKSVEWMQVAVDVLTIGLESLEEFGVNDVASFHIREMEFGMGNK